LATFKEGLQARLPARHAIAPVFSVVAFFAFSWSLYRMFYWLPSWLYYLNLRDIFWLACYVVSYCLFESLAMLGLMLLLCLVFPRRVLRDQFVTVGSVIAGTLGVAAFLLQRKIGLLLRIETEIFFLAPVVVIVVLVIYIFVIAWLLRRFQVLTRLIAALADRMTVFLYFYVPLGLLGALLVLVRNIILWIS
jgi:hypothetical protein